MKTLLDNTLLSNFSSIGRPDLVQLALGDAAATVEGYRSSVTSLATLL